MADIIESQNARIRARAAELAGTDGAQTKLWETEKGRIAILMRARFYLYGLYFLVAVAAIAFCASKGRWDWRTILAATGAAVAFPYIVPMIQWVLYKIGVFIHVLIMGASTPEIRNRYQFGVNSVP
jgi:hypothetical protein